MAYASRNIWPKANCKTARVSTYGQVLDTQLDQLRKAGRTKIFREKVTGARADRRNC